MNTGLPDSPEDRLLDELLREQAHGPDEVFLRRIEAAVDARHLPVEAQRPATGSNKWLAIAAGIALTTGAGLRWWSYERPLDTPAMSVTEPFPANPPSVKPGRTNAVAEAPRKNRLAPPNPTDSPDAMKRLMANENMAANRNLQEPNPFHEMSRLPSLVEKQPNGGALADSSNGKLLEKLSGKGAPDHVSFAEWVKKPIGDETPLLPLPKEIIPKGVPKGSNIKGHYGQAPKAEAGP